MLADLPAPLPDGVLPDSVYSFQPEGLEVNGGFTVTLPAPSGSQPGDLLDVWQFDPEAGQFVVIAQAAVGSDGVAATAQLDSLYFPLFFAPPASAGSVVRIPVWGQVLEVGGQGLPDVLVASNGQRTTTATQPDHVMGAYSLWVLGRAGGALEVRFTASFAEPLGTVSFVVESRILAVPGSSNRGRLEHDPLVVTILQPLTVQGRAVVRGQPAAGVDVVANAMEARTEADGTFSIASVAATFDVVLGSTSGQPADMRVVATRTFAGSPLTFQGDVLVKKSDVPPGGTLEVGDIELSGPKPSPGSPATGTPNDPSIRIRRTEVAFSPTTPDQRIFQGLSYDASSNFFFTQNLARGSTRMHRIDRRSVYFPRDTGDWESWYRLLFIDPALIEPRRFMQGPAPGVLLKDLAKGSLVPGDALAAQGDFLAVPREPAPDDQTLVAYGSAPGTPPRAELFSLREAEVFSSSFPYALEFSTLLALSQGTTAPDFGYPIVEADQEQGIFLGANLGAGASNRIEWYYANRLAGTALTKNGTTLGRHADYLLREPHSRRMFISSLGAGVEEVDPITGAILGPMVPGLTTRLLWPVFSPVEDNDGGGKDLLGVVDDTRSPKKRVSALSAGDMGGTRIVAIKRTSSPGVGDGSPHVAGASTNVYDLSTVAGAAGYKIYGLAFGRGTADPQKPNLFVLESNFPDTRADSARVRLVELYFDPAFDLDWGDVFDPDGAVPGLPPVPPALDTNNDGLIDAIEFPAIAALSQPAPDPSAVDPDGDGLTNFEELVIYNTNPLKADSDDDGFPDDQEVAAPSDPTNSGSWPPPNVLGGALEVQPGASGTRVYALQTTITGSSATLTLAGTLATFSGGATSLTLTDGETFSLEGTRVGAQGLATLTVREATSQVDPRTLRVYVRDTGFKIDAQCPVRSCPCTACPGSTADGQDGAFVNLANSVGAFMWRCQVLPSTRGRNGLTPDWTLRFNSRACSRGGWFGTTGATLACFERIRKNTAGALVYQEKEVREFKFDQLLPNNKATARARYEVISNDGSEIVIRRANGTKLRFHPLDGSLTAGALETIENRFGDVISHAYNSDGQLETVVGALGRTWTFSYDAQGRLDMIEETSANLLGRTCAFLYDAQDRLVRINTTAVMIDGGIGNTFPSGKPYELSYATTGVSPESDTNVTSVVYPREVLDGTSTPRYQNAYLPDDRLDSQAWGGTNAAAVKAGGTVDYAYGVATTTVTDRNGNVTTYSFNGNGQATSVAEASNRDVRGAGVDPASFVTSRTYNADEELTQLTLPLGGRVQFTFDAANADRYGQGNLLEVRRIADGRGGDGAGSAIADIVLTTTYEPIFQLPRTATSARGNHPVGDTSGFTPPIADDPAKIQQIDFDLDGTIDNTTAQDIRKSRYTSITTYDYQEGTAASVQALASAEGVTVSAAEATALSAGSDLNLDGTTSQQAGRPVEVRAPNVALESGGVQAIVTNFQWNALAQLVAEIDPEGYVDDYAYYPESAPSRPSQGATPDPPGRLLNATTGGYLQGVVRDNRTSIRTPALSAPRVRASTSTQYDNVGNQTQVSDQRGIVHTFVVNERNQVQVSIRAASTSALNPEEPRLGLLALGYETRTHFDGNDNLVKVEVENVVDQGGGNHQVVAGNPWLETTMSYDLLDDLLAQTQEVANGESRTIRGQSLSVGASESLTTRYRYDRNQNQVLALSPLQVAGVAGEANNVTSSIVDERDLAWKSTQGGIDAQWSGLTANADIVIPAGVTATARTATRRSEVDGNRNGVRTIDAEDNGSPHDGTGGLADTDDQTVAGTQRGDPVDKVFDGFDRLVTAFDAMGYQSATSCGCPGNNAAYDPDGNVLEQASIGPGGKNLRGDAGFDALLSRSRSCFDELGRVYRAEQDYFRAPVVGAAPALDPASPYVSTTLFDRSSRAIKQTRPLGDFVETDYDGLDRMIRRKSNPMTGAAGTRVPSEVVTRYDDASNVVQTEEIERSVEDAAKDRTFTTDVFYDAVGRPELRVSPHFAGNTANATRTEYDSRGNAVASLDANSSATIPQRVDRGGARTLMINASGNAVLSVHDGLGRVVSIVRELRIDHDGANVGLAGLDKSNPKNTDGLITTTQDWDANSRLAFVEDDPDTDPAAIPINPSRTTYAYDDLNRRTGQTNADGETKTTTYDRDSNALTHTDENGSVFTSTFDDISRVTQVSIARAAGVEGTTLQTCEYDGLSRKTRCTDDNGAQVDSVVVCSYDSLSRQQSCDQTIGAVAARSVSSEFDRNSNLIQLTYPGEVGGAGRRKVTYGYKDSASQTLNRVERIEEGAGSGTGNDILPSGLAVAKIATYGYLGPMRIDFRSYGNGSSGVGVLMSRTYDALRRIVGVQHSHASLGGVFVDLEYAFDRANNRLNEVFNHEGVQDVYRYDSAGRMLREDRGAALGGVVNNQVANPAVTAAENRTWDGLDGANNWNSVSAAGGFPSLTMTANEMNEYTAVDGVARTHDANGNLTFDGAKGYAFDAFNRLVRVEQGGVTIATYAYDHRGRRVRRAVTDGVNDEDIAYYYLGGRVIEEFDATARTVKRQYVWGPGGLLQYQSSGSFPGAPLYVHENGYGSVVATTDEALAPEGGVFDRFDYDAFGVSVRTGGIFDTGLPYRFRAWRLDAETGFYALAGGHYYQASLGRRICRGGGALLNLYAMGGNNLLWGPFGPLGGTLGSPGGGCGGGRKWVDDDTGLYWDTGGGDPFNRDTQGQAELGNVNFCGAKVDGWFLQEVALQVQKAKLALGPAPKMADYLHWALANQRYKDPDTFQFNQGQPKCGQRSPCGFSVTLFGTCIRSAALGNIMFGMVARFLGFASQATVKTPTKWKVKYGQTVDLDDEKSYQVGWNVMPFMTASYSKALPAIMSSFILGSPGAAGGKLQSCTPCTAPTNEKRHGGSESWGRWVSLKIKAAEQVKKTKKRFGF